jgi:hypothetical protein
LHPADKPARRNAAQNGGKITVKPEIEGTQIDDDPPSTEVSTFITTDFIEKFEEAAGLYQSRYLPACLRLTQPSDWIRMGERYFLQSTGAEKIAVPLGIEWKNLDIKKLDIGGGHYEYVVSGHITSKFLKREIYNTGNCDSRDKFLTAQPGWDEGSIRKAAISNFITNGVSRIAGIRNPTKEMLAKAGINPGAVGNVDYSGSGKTPEASKQVISEAQRGRLWAIIKGKGGDDAALKTIVEKHGYGSSKDISRADYEKICKEAEEWKLEREPGSDG